jgi:Flp pilus assembly protein TadG
MKSRPLLAGPRAAELLTCARRHRLAFWHDEGGHSFIELAIILPVFALMLLGAIEIGRMAYLGIAVHSAARAGVQYGAQNASTAINSTGMVAKANADASNITEARWWGSSAAFTATASYFCQCADGSSSTCAAASCSGSQRYTFVQVDTAALYTPFFQYPGLPPSQTLRGHAIMRVSQ